MLWVAILANAGVCGLLAGCVVLVQEDSAIQIAAVTGPAFLLLFATVNVIGLNHSDLRSHAMLWIATGLGVAACILREQLRWGMRESSN